MSGAYVALPATIPDPPSVPDGWGDWPFPGANPPGYESDYSLAFSAPASVSVGGSLSLSAVLRDHITWKTIPDTDALIRWTATVDGEAVQLRIGEGDYAAFLESVYTESTNFYGAAPTVTPQITAEQAGKTMIVTATTTVRGVEMSETAEVAVSSTEFTLEVTVTSDTMLLEDELLETQFLIRRTSPEPPPYTYVNISGVAVYSRNGGRHSWYEFEGNEGFNKAGDWTGDSTTGISPDDDTFFFSVNDFVGGDVIEVLLGLYRSDLAILNGKNLSVYAKVTVNGEEHDITSSGGSYVAFLWLRADMDTGEVAVLYP